MSTSDALPLAWLVLGVVIGVGVVVLIGRRVMTPKLSNSTDSDVSLVRSWIAVALVAGLLVFSAVALAIGDTALRSTLFGGVVASAGAAVAFYFSSKAADQARKDIMNAAFGQVVVPDLKGMQVGAARNLMSQSPLQIVVNPPAAPDDAEILRQMPPAGTNVRSGSVVMASALEGV